MKESEKISLVVLIALGVVVGVAFISVIAGNIVNNMLSDFPSVAGPMGGAIALAVFAGLLLKLAGLVFGKN